MTEKEKIKSYISIAMKANYAIIGSDNLKKYRQKLYLVLADKTAGKNLLKIAKRYEPLITVIYVDSVEELSGIEKCKILGIKNKGISDKIIEILRSI